MSEDKSFRTSFFRALSDMLWNLGVHLLIVAGLGVLLFLAAIVFFKPGLETTIAVLELVALWIGVYGGAGAASMLISRLVKWRFDTQ